MNRLECLEFESLRVSNNTDDPNDRCKYLVLYNHLSLMLNIRWYFHLFTIRLLFIFVKICRIIVFIHKKTLVWCLVTKVVVVIVVQSNWILTDIHSTSQKLQSPYFGTFYKHCKKYWGQINFFSFGKNISNKFSFIRKFFFCLILFFFSIFFNHNEYTKNNGANSWINFFFNS